MSGNKTILKRSAVPGRVPTITQVGEGELGINLADKKLYYGTGSEVVEVTNKADTDDITINLSNHVNNDSVHLTSTQNTLLDNITVSASEINELSGVTSNIQSQLNSKELSSNKGIANGYAALDSSGKVPTTQLPPNDVLSVNGHTGTVTLTTTDITEGTNEYFTTLRARQSISSSGSVSYDNGTGVITNDADLDAIASLSGQSGILTKTDYNTWSLDTNSYTLSSVFNAHNSDQALHLTSAQNTWIDAITVTSTQVNYLSGLTSNVQTQLNGKQASLGFTPENSANKGISNGYASLGADGKIPSNQLPNIAITDTFVVATQLDMLALVAEVGDIAVRSDLNKTYILKGTDPTVLANWQELLTPTNSVLSVNGFTGAITLTTTNISEGTNQYFTTARARTSISTTGTSLTYNNTTGVLSTDSDLDAMASLATTGLIARTGTGTASTRTITGTTNYINVTNGNGVAGNPTLTIGANVVTTDTVQTITSAKTFSAAITSTLATGTAPFTITSTTKVTNLNADLLDGLDSTAFQLASTDLAAIAALAGTSGILTKTGVGTWSLDTTSYATSAALTAHNNDFTSHLTSTQNTWIDAITATSTEVNYLSGATSNIQTQLNGKQASLGYSPENLANKGVANGYASLDATGKVPSSQLPADAVTSVNSQTGAVVLTTTDISEGTNQYFTNARARLSISVTGSSLLYNNTTGILSTDSDLDAIASLAGTSGILTKTASNTWSLDTTSYTPISSYNSHIADTTLHLTSAQNTWIDAITVSSTEVNYLSGVSSNLQSQLNGKQASLGFTPENSANKGAANGYAPLDGTSKIPASYLPSIAISDTFVVASQVAMLALTAQTGDVAVRTDLNKSFILKGTDPTLLTDWQELLTPTDAITSVNGQTGVVVLTTTNISEGTNLYYTNARARAAISTTGSSLSYNNSTGILSTDADLDAIASLAGTSGFLTKTAANTWALDTSSYVTTATFTSHTGDATVHLTSAQNTWIDAITASSTEVNYLVGVTNSIQTQLNGKQASLGFTPENSANKGTVNGYASLDGSGKVPLTQISITTTNVVEGTNLYYTDVRARAAISVTGSSLNYASGVLSTDADLDALASLATTGFTVRTGAGTAASRTLTGTTNYLTITNGDGVAGNPTLNIGANVVTTDTIQTVSAAKTFNANVAFGLATGTAPFTVNSSTKVTSLNADLLDGLDSTAFQPIDSDLTAYAALNTIGIVSRTGSSTVATRIITGTTNQITVTNGDGASGDPTIALANNLVLPGTAKYTWPSGTTAQRPSPASNGDSRFNTDIGFYEQYYNGTWYPVPRTANLGVVQARRTTTYTTTTTFTSITFDTVDVVSDTTICNRDGTTTSNFVAYQAGYYEFNTSISVIASATSSVLNLQLIKNGTTVLPNTESERPASTTSRDDVFYTTIVYLAANDSIALQLSHTSSSLTVQVGTVMTMKKLEGTTGQTGAMGGQSTLYFPSTTLDNPNNANWTINALAPVIADTANNALSVRAFDDTAEEGVGFTVYIPPTAVSISFNLVGKAATAPGSNVGAVMRTYTRTINIGSAVGAWSSANALSTLVVPANIYYQSYAQTISLTTLGLTAGTTVQFELTRHGANASDTLVGDFHLLNLTVNFS